MQPVSLSGHSHCEKLAESDDGDVICYTENTADGKVDLDTDTDIKLGHCAKNICTSSIKRTHSETAANITEANLTKPDDSIIDGSCDCVGNTDVTSSKRIRSEAWASEFSARPSDEKPRNCKAINSTVKDSIMMLVFKTLMEASDATVKQLTDGRSWNAGGTMTIMVHL